MNKYVNFIKNNRKILIIIFLLLNIFSIIGLFKININPDFRIFMPTDSVYKNTLDKMNSYFNSSDQISFLIENNNENFTVDNIKKLRTIQTFLEKQDNIKYINGPTPEKIPIGRQILDINNINENNLSDLIKHFKTMGNMSTIYQKNKNTYALFTIFPRESFSNKNLNSIEDFLKDNNINYFATGNLYMQQKIIDYITMILLLIPPAALLLILFVFNTQMGSIKATFFSILPAGIAALWTMGIIGWTGMEVSIITVLAPIFTIVIGSADGLHFISHLQEYLREGKNNISSIISSLKMIGIPMVITTITSMIGFLALLIMNTQAIFELALFASLGVFLAGIATWFILPLLLSGNINIPHGKESKELFTNNIKRLWGKPSVIILIILILISIVGILNINTEFNMPMFYRNYTDIYKSYNKIKEVTGGSLPLYLLSETKEDPLQPEYANFILELQNNIENKNLVTKSMSVYDIYSTIYSRFINSNNIQYPQNLNYINMINQMAFSNSNFNPTSQFIKRDDNITRIILFPQDLNNETLQSISDFVIRENNRNNNINLNLTGVQYLMHDLNKDMLNNQKNTLYIAFLFVLILLFISLKKLLPALISILPIAFTVVILFGFLGLSNISLNLFTATIFSITIGVGIDYAVHFTSVWMKFKNEGNNSLTAVNKAYDYTSRPIMANALGLAIGLSALLMSPLRIHLYVSSLMWVSMISGVFLSLSFLPTILQKLK